MSFNIAKLFIFGRFLNVFWTLLNTRVASLPKALNCSRSRNAIKTKEKLWKPSIIDLQNDELIKIPSGFTMFLKLARSMISSPSNPSKITNFYRSQNAIQTNEMLSIPGNMNSATDEHLNIPLVLLAFLNSLQRIIWIASKAPRKVDLLWIIAGAQTI